jgi:molybdate transport system substrate-binding protein
VFQRLGVADRVLPRSRRIVGERVCEVVARGDAAIGFQQMSELLPIAGIDIVGPLPAPLQRVTVFAGAVGISTRDPQAARRYLAFLAAPESARVIAATGMEPMVAARVAARPGTRHPTSPGRRPATTAGS